MSIINEKQTSVNQSKDVGVYDYEHITAGIKPDEYRETASKIEATRLFEGFSLTKRIDTVTGEILWKPKRKNTKPLYIPNKGVKSNREFVMRFDTAIKDLTAGNITLSEYTVVSVVSDLLVDFNDGYVRDFEGRMLTVLKLSQLVPIGYKKLLTTLKSLAAKKYISLSEEGNRTFITVSPTVAAKGMPKEDSQRKSQEEKDHRNTNIGDRVLEPQKLSSLGQNDTMIRSKRPNDIADDTVTGNVSEAIEPTVSLIQ